MAEHEQEKEHEHVRGATRRVDLGEYEVLRAPEPSTAPVATKSRTTRKVEAGA